MSRHFVDPMDKKSGYLASILAMILQGIFVPVDA